MNRRQALKSFLTGALEAAGVAVVASTTVAKSVVGPSSEGDLQQRANQLAGSGESLESATGGIFLNFNPNPFGNGGFSNGGFRNGFNNGGFSNGFNNFSNAPFRNGGVFNNFSNSPFRNGGVFNNSPFRNGFNNGGFGNGGFNNGGFRNGFRN